MAAIGCSYEMLLFRTAQYIPFLIGAIVNCYKLWDTVLVIECIIHKVTQKFAFCSFSSQKYIWIKTVPWHFSLNEHFQGILSAKQTQVVVRSWYLQLLLDKKSPVIDHTITHQWASQYTWALLWQVVLFVVS